LKNYKEAGVERRVEETGKREGERERGREGERERGREGERERVALKSIIYVKGRKNMDRICTQKNSTWFTEDSVII
jgi:hypothetical protein